MKRSDTQEKCGDSGVHHAACTHVLYTAAGQNSPTLVQPLRDLPHTAAAGHKTTQQADGFDGISISPAHGGQAIPEATNTEDSARSVIACHSVPFHSICDQGPSILQPCWCAAATEADSRSQQLLPDGTALVHRIRIVMINHVSQNNQSRTPATHFWGPCISF